MKRTLFLLLIIPLICSARFAYGDEIKSIKLDNKGHDKETISLPFCNIFVELQLGNEDGQYGIFIKMENISEDKIVYLFDKSYNEKTLKKMKIVYDKLFPGTKRKRIAEACNHIPESYRLLPASEIKNIINFQGNDNTIKCRLPIYIARYNKKKFVASKKNKISLAQKEVIELNIDVEMKPDEDYIKLSEATDSLIHEIERETFCSNKKHQGISLEALYSRYNKSIDALKRRVLRIVSLRNYMSSDKAYREFMAIHDKLNSINLEQLTVTSCDNDEKPKLKSAHSCRYCSLSAREIYNKLESYYIDLHNGVKTKEQVISDVETLYNCAQKNRKRTLGNYMSRISDYYNKIKSK